MLNILPDYQAKLIMYHCANRSLSICYYGLSRTSILCAFLHNKKKWILFRPFCVYLLPLIISYADKNLFCLSALSHHLGCLKMSQTRLKYLVYFFCVVIELNVYHTMINPNHTERVMLKILGNGVLLFFPFALIFNISFLSKRCETLF